MLLIEACRKLLVSVLTLKAVESIFRNIEIAFKGLKGFSKFLLMTSNWHLTQNIDQCWMSSQQGGQLDKGSWEVTSQIYNAQHEHGSDAWQPWMKTETKNWMKYFLGVDQSILEYSGGVCISNWQGLEWMVHYKIKFKISWDKHW